jgi:hypothetical protein
MDGGTGGRFCGAQLVVASAMSVSFINHSHPSLPPPLDRGLGARPELQRVIISASEVR